MEPSGIDFMGKDLVLHPWEALSVSTKLASEIKAKHPGALLTWRPPPAHSFLIRVKMPCR